MSNERYSVKYTPKGISIDADGFVGGACEKELEDILRFLKSAGINTSVEDKKKKAETYAGAMTGSQQSWGGR
jgi:hypothetical protein